MSDMSDAATVGNGGGLRIVMHGQTLGRVNAQRLAERILRQGYEASGIELISCNSATGIRGRIAAELSSILKIPVKAAKGNVNVLQGIEGVPQVRSVSGELMAPGKGWKTFGWWRKWIRW